MFSNMISHEKIGNKNNYPKFLDISQKAYFPQV